jgi:hypothetical protein
MLMAATIRKTLGFVLVAGIACLLGAPAFSNVTELDGAGQTPSFSRKTYEFHCGSRDFAISLETRKAGDVQLKRFDLPDALAADDRQKVQAALNRFAFVYDVGLRCDDGGINGINYVYVDGLPLGVGTAAPAGRLAMVLLVKGGHLLKLLF